MSKLIVCEKPAQANKYQPFLNKNDKIIIAPCVVGYRFLFDKELKFNELPFFNHSPQYKKNIAAYEEYKATKWIKSLFITAFDQDKRLDHPLFINFHKEKSRNTKTELYASLKREIHEFLSSFDEIIFACDTDHTGVRGFDFLFKYYYEINNIEDFCNQNNIELNSYENYCLSDKEIKKGIKNKKRFYESTIYNQGRVFYQNKDYFEYNYSLNSLLLLNKAYYLSFDKYPNHIITKNFIQTLFYIKENNSLTEGKIIGHMNKSEIGNPASRTEILLKLYDLNLVKKTEKNVFLSNEGATFMDLLHRKLNDPHLAKRLENDYENLTHSEFRDKYGKYLKTVFSKQKRFINKNM